MSGYLHDLGICLHFQDDPVLKHTVILRPTWGTDAVYRVLDDAGVIDAQGQFARTDLTRIWGEPEHAGNKDPIRAFMRRAGQSRAVVLVLSEPYLCSPNCMFELMRT